ncbi:hypothetical protein [Agromyces marinus]|uniref:hypothetical protein n=1 Tax=Agromyces marinus TaxID=1389020 RepID=UPI001F3A7217|nr:hypothetical protein [Agromyces marinus]
MTGVIHDLFPTNAPHLADRLVITMDLLASWHFQEVAAEVLIEEIHTAAELMLKSLGLPRSKRMSFAELIDGAHDQGLIDERSSQTLHALKSTRVGAKHRGSADAKEWLDANFWDVVAALERLSAKAKAPLNSFD